LHKFIVIFPEIKGKFYKKTSTSTLHKPK